MWGAKSRAEISRAHPDLQRVLERVDARWSCTILQGERTVEEQANNVRSGVSKTLKSKHVPEYSSEPERGVDAVDVAPDPFQWPDLERQLRKITALVEGAAQNGHDERTAEDLRAEISRALKDYGKDLGRWYAFAGYVHAVGDELYARGEISSPLRHGYDWDGDHRLTDQSFDDLPHVERS